MSERGREGSSQPSQLGGLLALVLRAMPRLLDVGASGKGILAGLASTTDGSGFVKAHDAIAIDIIGGLVFHSMTRSR